MTTYYYRVAARTTAGLGPLSNEVMLVPSDSSSRLCSADGWCWDRGPVQGETIQALFARSEDEAVALAGSTAMRWDGLGWTAMPGVVYGYAPLAQHVWSSGPDDIWLLEPQPQHWDGQAWRGVDIPVSSVAGIWGNAADDVWVAGGGSVAHWNGLTWSATHDDALGRFHVRDVWTDGADGVWIAGNGIYGQGGSVLRFDGNGTQMILTGQKDVNALWGSAPDDVWLVGDYGTLHHWDGVRWTSLGFGIEHIRDVDGCASDDVWAVGHHGLVLHWNGEGWTRAPLSLDTNFRAVACTPQRTWVGGEDGELLTWTPDSGWSTPAAARFGPLRGIAQTRRGPVVVGEYETILARDEQSWAHLSGTFEASYPNISLHAMHGKQPDDLWAVGDAGAMLHWDGKEWSSRTPITSFGLRTVWANASDDVWAAGERGALLHFDGTSWRAHEAGSTVAFDALWGAAQDDVWAAGWDGLSHWDGQAWEHVATPDLPQGQSVDHLWGSSATDIWATSSHDTLLRWNGSTWQRQNVGFKLEAFLGNVTGTGPNDVWLFQRSWYAHFDGSRWSRTDWGSDFSPSFGQVTPNGTVWLLGGAKTRYWDGRSWVSASTARPRRALSLFAVDDDHVYTVGEYATIHRWSGDTWQQESPTPPNPQHYGDIWFESDDRAWIVGDYGAIRHWDGSTWEEHQSGTLAQLFAVTGSASDDVWAAGEGGTLLHFDGSSWSAVESGTAVTINDLFAISPDNVIAVGGDPLVGASATYDAAILRWDGSRWLPDSVPNVPSLTAVWAVAADDIWAVGDNGTSLHWNGLAWTEVTTSISSSETLLGVWAHGSNAVWAAGTNGTVVRWNGASWQREAAPTRLALFEIGGNADAVWAIGADGAILRRDLE
jgi:hypothetical protein